ncbi:disease resistance protein RPM1-like [Prunus yedoensis var. nudiflora]|uniref:Disease resistance protein RPM1-like n=1 Tax=Prunus yedoensis var. nudiflora TaxID=2094558 RepID=A0A314UWV6_PRUYE|nr:disease resistance protein RPM1-like [Prunus yedoensis var. nudiflora]
MIQAAETTPDGRVQKFRIHDLLREIITSKTRDQNFATIAKEYNMPWPDKVARLSIHNTLQYVQQYRSASQLRSLFMFRVAEKPSLQRFSPTGFTLLNVLDLQSTPLNVFPAEVVNLFFLKYLSLKDTRVKTVPTWIGKLQNLETLDLKNSRVTELPVEILKLQHLRHLLVYHYEFLPHEFHSKYGFKVLGKIGALTSLQKLCFIEVNQDGGAILIELGKLVQLRRLGIVKMRKEYGKAFCSSVEKLTKICSLSITSVEEDEIIDLEYLFFSSSTASAALLARTTGDVTSLDTFSSWPLHLLLSEAFEGDTLRFGAGGFKKLKRLCLDKSDQLRCIWVEAETMPCIEQLSIKRCKSLEKVPLGIEHLITLKVLEFSDMPEKLIRTLLPHEQGNDYWKVAHIPEVHITYWREWEWKVYSLEGLSEAQKSHFCCK